jgi:hypothetical protein
VSIGAWKQQNKGQTCRIPKLKSYINKVISSN